MFNLKNKVVVVTGSARGAGLGMVTAASKRGAKIVVIDLHQKDVDAAVNSLSGEALGLAVDVTDREGLARAVDKIIDHFGRIDVVVANAGIAARIATLRTTPVEVFDRIIEVNLKGVYNTVMATMPHVVAAQGHFTLVASVMAFMNGAGSGSYASSKAGVEQLGRLLRTELASDGVTVGVAYFGYIETEMTAAVFDCDPVAAGGFANLPGPLRKHVAASDAGETVIKGIERRAPRTITPPAWILISFLRGIVNPVFDAIMPRLKRTKTLIHTLDTRAGVAEPLTAAPEPAIVTVTASKRATTADRN